MDEVLSAFVPSGFFHETFRPVVSASLMFSKTLNFAVLAWELAFT